MTQEEPALTICLTQRVSAEIRAELGRQRMSQRQLAEKLGIHPTLVSRRLRGGKDRSWTIDELDQIARILGVRVEQLIATRPVVAVAA